MFAHPQTERTAWLLAIGQQLRVEYTALEEPMPEHLAALVKQLEAGERHPDARPAGDHLPLNAGPRKEASETMYLWAAAGVSIAVIFAVVAL